MKEKSESILVDLGTGKNIVGLAADPSSKNVYFADASDSSIRSILTDTLKESLVIRDLGVGLCCLEINKRNGDLYWKASTLRDGLTHDSIYMLQPRSPVKQLLYTERKRLEVKAIVSEPNGTFIFWCFAGDGNERALLKFHVSARTFVSVPLVGINGSCISLAADHQYVYMLTALRNRTNALYAISMTGSAPYAIVAASDIWTGLTDIAVADMAPTAEPATSTQWQPTSNSVVTSENSKGNSYDGRKNRTTTSDYVLVTTEGQRDEFDFTALATALPICVVIAVATAVTVFCIRKIWGNGRRALGAHRNSTTEPSGIGGIVLRNGSSHRISLRTGQERVSHRPDSSGARICQPHSVTYFGDGECAHDGPSDIQEESDQRDTVYSQHVLVGAVPGSNLQVESSANSVASD